MTEQEMDAEISKAKRSLVRLSCSGFIYGIASVEAIKETIAGHLWVGGIEIAAISVAMHYFLKFE